MFKQKYQEEMAAIKPSRELINHVKSEARAEFESRPQFKFKRVAGFATAVAVAAMAIFAVPNFMTDNEGGTPMLSNNSFALTAFAAEAQPDGTVTTGRQLEFNQSAEDSWTMVTARIGEDGQALEMEFHTNIAFKYTGENIESVTFSVDKGFFSRIGDDYMAQRLGNSVTMQNGSINDTLLWGIDLISPDAGRTHIESRESESGGLEITLGDLDPGILTLNDMVQGEIDRFFIGSVTITAVVTFTDGEVQEHTIVYDTSSGLLMLMERLQYVDGE